MTLWRYRNEDHRAVSEFVRTQIETLLAEAAAALREANWPAVRARAETILALDPANSDAAALVAAANRAAPSTLPPEVVQAAPAATGRS